MRSRRTRPGGKRWGDWAEAQWDVLAMAVTFAGALAVAATLALVFNVIETRLEPGLGATGSVPTPVSDARPSTGERPES